MTYDGFFEYLPSGKLVTLRRYAVWSRGRHDWPRCFGCDSPVMCTGWPADERHYERRDVRKRRFMERAW